MVDSGLAFQRQSCSLAGQQCQSVAISDVDSNREPRHDSEPELARRNDNTGHHVPVHPCGNEPRDVVDSELLLHLVLLDTVVCAQICKGNKL